MAPRSVGPHLLGVMFSLSSLSTILVGLRMYCRVAIIRSVTPDDYLIMIALVNGWGMCVSNYFHVYYGTGKHAADLTDFDKILIPTLKLWYTYQLQYLIVLFFTKASILSFYWRLSRQRAYRTSILVVASIVSVYTIAMLFINIFECPDDISRAWKPTFPIGCNDLVAIYYGMAAFNILSDLVILLLPLPTVLGLQVNRRKRAALLVVFSCGSIAVVASIVRINALVMYQAAVKNMDDVPYVAAYILLWSQVEVNVAISTASAPALQPLLRHVLGGSTWAKSYGIGYGPSGSRQLPGQSGYGRHGREQEIVMGAYSGGGGGGGGGGTKGGTLVVGGATGSMNGSSQEHIVKGGGVIVRTTDVEVDIEMSGRPRNDSDESLRRLEFGQ